MQDIKFAEQRHQEISRHIYVCVFVCVRTCACVFFIDFWFSNPKWSVMLGSS